VSLVWIAYLPIPGLGLVPALARPDDRFHRYHAHQGGWAVVAWWLGLLLLGSLAMVSEATAYRIIVGSLTMAWLVAGVAMVAFGVVWSVTGRFGRMRPVWDVLSLLGR
jgi:hypothetical protein